MDLRKLVVLRYFDRASSGFPAWTMSAPCRTLAVKNGMHWLLLVCLEGLVAVVAASSGSFTNICTFRGFRLCSYIRCCKESVVQ